MDEQEQQEHKSVTASSIRSCEVILYPPQASLESTLEIIKEHSIKDFAMVLHGKDDKKPHIHALLWLNNPTPTENVIKWFAPLGVTLQNLGRIKSKKGALAYLTHSNRPEKAQYDITEVIRSDSIKDDLETATSESMRKREIVAMCDKVANGEMSPKTLYRNLSGVELRDYEKLVKGSIEARLTKSTIKGERNMEVLYIYGKPGSGKSTLARWLASTKDPNETPYISSSSNDPLQDYMLEPVIVLDDLRGDSFKFVDLLKLLDNHVPSSVKCRYRNKTIDAKTMIITSTRLPTELYSDEVFTANDNIKQLLRRITGILYIDPKGKIWQWVYQWSNEKQDYVIRKYPDPLGDMANVYLAMDIVRTMDLHHDALVSIFDGLIADNEKKKKQDGNPNTGE